MEQTKLYAENEAIADARAFIKRMFAFDIPSERLETTAMEDVRWVGPRFAGERRPYRWVVHIWFTIEEFSSFPESVRNLVTWPTGDSVIHWVREYPMAEQRVFSAA